VTIGKHVQISMNSVVTHDLPPYCVAGGAPARVLRMYDFSRKKWMKAESDVIPRS
jgi:acetyltransferase-like isoleucine patch superfamily enzyme